jgi:gluconolactonase
MRKRPITRWLAIFASMGVISLAAACTQESAWKAKNDRLIREKALTVRTRTDIPNSKVAPNLEPGVVTNFSKLPVTELAPGIKAKVYWGKGVLVAWSILDPKAEIARETLPSERLMIVMKGSVHQLAGENSFNLRAVPRDEPDGIHGRTPKNEFIYLEKGAPNALRAGNEGAEVIEIYCPPRLDYMKKAGAASLPAALPGAESALRPTVEPNRVYDLYDLPLTNLVPGSNSRLIGTRGLQASFIRMDPGTSFSAHIHPEEQIMTTLRGTINELILDGSAPMAKGDLLLLPGDMVHGGVIGELGCDALDVFWPARPDYDAKRVGQRAAFEEVIPGDAKLELFVDGAKQGPGLVFTESPKWLAGKLYLSSMFFDRKWNGDPKRSATVEMSEDGAYRYISHGRMQTNGLMPLPNGNLAVCDMFGHRVIEMTIGGRIVRTLASTYEGKPIDGPNDIVADAKGGLYFTDPQFTPDAKKFQPGRAVYYITPKGTLLRVIEPNAFAMPNGIFLSPDGKTLFVNNTYDNETWWNVDSDKDEWVWAFDVNDDGTVANGRRFAKLFLNAEVLDRKGRSSGADGMTIDERGDIFVATWHGLQVFNSKGDFLGLVNTPVYPVSCCFGGADMKTLYVVGFDKIYRIRTNVTGLKYGPR